MTGFFGAGGGGGWKLLSTATALASAQVDFTADIDDAFQFYKIMFSGVHPSAGATQLHVRLRQGGSFAASGYSYAGIRPDSGATFGAFGNGAATAIKLSDINLDAGASRSISGWIEFDDPSSETYDPQVRFCTAWPWNAGTLWTASNGAARLNAAGAVDGVRFLMSSGNIDAGEFALYGLKGK